jgi:hypothetical protein
VDSQVMKLIDLHDLYGSVAYPKRHTQNDISDIYLFPRSTHGIFTNIALQEPFGLTVIEVCPKPWIRPRKLRRSVTLTHSPVCCSAAPQLFR